MSVDTFRVVRPFQLPQGEAGTLYSLPALEQAGVGQVSRLPVSLRIILEALLRNEDGSTVTADDIRALAGWQPAGARDVEVPFVVARVMAPDSSGLPLLADLLSMRAAASAVGEDPHRVEPTVPVDLVIDHSVQVDVSGQAGAVLTNMTRDFERNAERYRFLKWAGANIGRLKVIPPGVGICHQVNLEYLAPGLHERDGVYFPDTLYGADSHTTMINGIGVVGWGVGGIEAESAMLGHPTGLLLPDVVGVHLSGRLHPGATATDAVLTVVETLRKVNVVGKFVEFFGEGAASLSATDRATLANMGPEYGATIGFFPIDEVTLDYFTSTGRSPELVDVMRAYYTAQGLFGMSMPGDVDYSSVVDIDLGSVVPSVAGPRRPQDRIALPDLRSAVATMLGAPVADGGYGRESGHRASASVRTSNGTPVELTDGSVVVAAITSCTNTSNPSVMLAAGLLAKKAVERGLAVSPGVKTSLAPGSRVVTRYLDDAGLQPYLDKLGFQVVGYGCTTCIGNSGPLDPTIEQAIVDNDLVTAAVLSGNRNFEARIHSRIKANFLMSPPLVVAMAIAGRVDVDVTSEPLGTGSDGKPVYLSDIWPTPEEVTEVLGYARDPKTFRQIYADLHAASGRWQDIPVEEGADYAWKPESTYLKRPPFLDGFTLEVPPLAPITGARPLAILGDTVTTDHISPGGQIPANTPAGQYLQEHGVAPRDFNTYIARRANHEVMIRGTFANVRIRNVMVPGREGGFTTHQPDGELTTVYEAATRYLADGVPTIVVAGELYGTGSSRDWASKGTRLLGVRAVLARSFERIHRSNLVMLGVLPLQFLGDDSATSLGLDGTETFDVLGVSELVEPRQLAVVRIHRASGETQNVEVQVRVDTRAEADYYRHGGILPYVLRSLLEAPPVG